MLDKYYEGARHIDAIPPFLYLPLVIGVTLAALLTAISYSYCRDLLGDLKDDLKRVSPDDEKYRTKHIRISNYICSLDLLLTQSMAQVFFSSTYGLILFCKNVIPGLCCVFTVATLSTVFLQFLFACYSGYQLWSPKKRNGLEPYFYWKDKYAARLCWLILTIINIFVTLIFLFFIFIVPCFPCPFPSNEWSSVYFPVLFISYLSLILIAYAVSPIFPLALYSPLQEELENLCPPSPPPSSFSPMATP